MLEMSGSCGPCPTSPQAKPANPAPSFANSSMCETGTSFALGAPVNSTNEQKTYSTPFFDNSDLSSSVMFSASVRDCSSRFFSYKISASKSRWGKRFNQLRWFARGNQFRHAFSGNGSGFETVSTPSHIHVEIADFGRHSDDWGEIRCHIADSRPLPQDTNPVQLREQFERICCHLLKCR